MIAEALLEGDVLRSGQEERERRPVSRAMPQTKDLHGTWLVLVMASIGMTVVAYNTTAVITIMPNLQSDFDLRPTTLQWVMTIYTISGATLVPIMGRLSDLVGKMKVYILGALLFGLGALAVTLSQDAFLLLLGRLAQGLGAASLFGTSLAVLSAATPESQRSFVLGLWGAMVALGMSLGPIIGGLFAEYLSWRGVFVSDLILIALCLVFAVHVVRAGYVPLTRQPARFDYAGAVSLILLLGPLTFALTHGESQGWTSPVTLGCLAVALAAGIVFVAIELRIREPLIYLRYLRHPHFLMSALGMMLVGIFLMGLLVYFSLFVQSPDTLALSPVLAGAALLPLTAILFAFSVGAPRILAPYSPHWPVTAGMIALMAGCLLLAGTGNDSTYDDIWWKLMVVGIGFGLTMPLLPHVGLRVLPEAHTGQGSGMINTCLYFGASLGVVLGGLVTAITIRTNIDPVLDALPVDSPGREALSATLTHGSPTELQQALAALDPASSEALRAALRAVQDDAFDHTMLALAAVGAIGALLAAWLLRGPVPAPHSAASLAKDDA